MDENITVEKYIDYFLWTHRRKGVSGRIVKENTFSSYVDRGRLIKEEIGKYKVAELTYTDIDEAIQNIHKRTCDSTARQTRDLVVSMMKFAKKDGVVKENILQDEVITLRERKGKKEKKIIHREDEEMFIKYCLENNCIEILMLLFSGIRSSELAGLTWKCLDFEEKKIKIKEEYLWVDETDYIDGKIVITNRVKKVTDVKTDGSDRSITLSDSFIELLKQHKERQKELAKSNDKVFKENDFIFTTKNYNGYVSDFTYDKFKKIVNILKIKDYEELTPHCLRHSFCSRGIREGVELKEMSGLLGHSNIGVTADWYAKLDDEQIRQASTKVNKSVDKYLEKAIINEKMNCENG